MRSDVVKDGDFSVRAISGTRSVLLCFDVAPASRAGLLGFAIKRSVGGAAPIWLQGKKVFRSVLPNPAPEDQHSTWDFPVQSLLWGDYTARPGTKYAFEVYPVYGPTGNLDHRGPIVVEIETEPEWGETHSVFFNRGAIASQAFAERFDNKPPEDPDDPDDPETQWLARGLLRACLDFIDRTKKGEGLRVAAYEFTYEPIIKAFLRAIERGVDLMIVHEAGTMKKKGVVVETEATKSAAKALKKYHFPAANLIKRTRRANIPHNKFIVRLDKTGHAREVWTGSTNFTQSGFLGQANVGHAVKDDAVAKQFFDYWTELAKDPGPDELRPAVLQLTPERKLEETIDPGTTTFFSPRPKASMLKWYAKRVEEAEQVVMFTGAFGVNKALVPAFAEDRDILRYLVLEKPPTTKTREALGDDHDLVTVPGQVLGEVWTKNAKGELTLRRPIPGFELEKWFAKEELFRKTGNIFFIHLKVLILDPLTDDPLVFSGSANFSDNSLTLNDENMLLIRGDTRVADIYLTEYDRILRHFYFRDIAARFHDSGHSDEAIFLKEDESWLAPSYWATGLKARRQKMFFP